MTILVKIKDGSEFKVDTSKIKSIFIDRKFLKIIFKKEDIRFEKIQLESFEVYFPRDWKNNSDPSDYGPYESMLVTILTNILQNSE